MTVRNGHAIGRHGVVIVGGGLAAQRCAETLRRHGYEGRIRIVCSEARRPYDRPPLSKALLAGTTGEESLPYRPAEWYEQQAIDLLLGISATSLRPPERRLELSDRTPLRYDRLLIACGSRPRGMAMLAGYENVSVLRDVEDSITLREALLSSARLVVIGAGFVGQEAAATARRLGVEVTMIEAAVCPLATVLGSKLGGWFTHLHRSEGVEVITGRTVREVNGNHRVRSLRLTDGRVVQADHVLVGIGVDPDTSWLAGSGLEFGAGVPVDPDGRSAITGVLAAGDAAATYQRPLGRHVPGSHWEAAGRQGARAARAMLGLDGGPATVTSFWTDQYGVRIQYLGHGRPSDQIVIDGDPSASCFTATFMRAGRPMAALLVGRPRELAGARNLIEKGAS